MSKPNFMTHVVRAIAKELSATRIIVDNDLKLKREFPSIVSNRNFAEEYFLYNLTRKYEPAAGSYDPAISQRKSLQKWADSEHVCRVVNLHGRFASPIPSRKPVIDRLRILTKMHASRILCDHWPSFEKIEMTGGASNLSKRKYCHPAAKLSGMPDPTQSAPHNLACVNGASEILEDLLENNPLVLKHLRDRFTDYNRVETNRTDAVVEWLVKSNTPAKLDFVPKDDESVRLIAKSGSFSTAIQRSLGLTIRKALLAEGVDLSTQHVNQEWAEIGSLTGLVATVDLSSASDNISLMALEYLPKRWQEYLLSTRDTSVTVDGNVVHRLEKIASMGNGFIFELETLLFYAMSLAVCDVMNLNTSWVTVYGDDIIVPSQAVPLLEEFFTINGFTLNATKSFAGNEGFRESCGKHYYKGQDVTPFYIRSDAITLSDLYHLTNGLACWSFQTGVSLEKSISLCVQKIPANRRNMVPLTWSSRSGLHYNLGQGTRVPTEKWCKHLQRNVIKYTVLKSVTRDLDERYPDVARYFARLLALEARTVVFDFSSLGALTLSRLGRGVMQLSEVTKASFPEIGKERHVIDGHVQVRHKEKVGSTTV